MTAAVSPRWVLAAPPDAGVARALAADLGVPEVLAALLVQRGVSTVEAAKAFLRPDLGTLPDPLALHGMAAAVEAVVTAVRSGQTILVHGDYDVDGQCATTVLTRALRLAGATVEPFVPHRMSDGYDFGAAGLARAREVGAGLILTCDCGITAVETVAAAAAAGMPVVVTDHHLPGPVLPAAVAIVNPQQPGDQSGLDALCGTGVAFMLVRALVPALGLPPSLPMHLLDLVALATVADVVPLVGVNRTLVRHGLKLLGRSRWAGIQALLDTSGLAGKELRAGQVGYILAPRLNAAGRVGDAMDGVRLLLSDAPSEARSLAEHLERMNTERQALDQRILEEALVLAEQQAVGEGSPSLVLAGDGWHPGVVGIVASRVVEQWGRPTFLIGLDGEVGRGSGRSISRFDLHAALHACGDLLERYGGHRMAAGLTIRRDQVPAFRERFREMAARTLSVEDLGPEQRVDLEIDLSGATDDLERLVSHLEPCGMGNPAPVFGVRAASFAEWQTVGRNHLKGSLRQGSQRLPAIGFQMADRTRTFVGRGPVDAAFRLERNDFRGVSSLQARLLALAPHAPAPAGEPVAG
jgi:single-stranded-DNA-specific exonuclease